MQSNDDFPALYRSADILSGECQRRFLGALVADLCLLVAASALSTFGPPCWQVAVGQALVLLGALGCTIYLAARRPDRLWYGARAIAESVKTMTWRFACRAEPYDVPDASAEPLFRANLAKVVQQNQIVAGELTAKLTDPQVTPAMTLVRSRPLQARVATYVDRRIDEQLRWYGNKARLNKRHSTSAFAWLIALNTAAIFLALLRIKFPDVGFWPTDVLVTAAAGLLTWMQTKRFTELSASYALAAHEISLLSVQAVTDDQAFSTFVGDAENAFSREHTQWTARRDA
jgi:hypothetical protein